VKSLVGINRRSVEDPDADSPLRGQRENLDSLGQRARWQHDLRFQQVVIGLRLEAAGVDGRANVIAGD